MHSAVSTACEARPVLVGDFDVTRATFAVLAAKKTCCLVLNVDPRPPTRAIKASFDLARHKALAPSGAWLVHQFWQILHRNAQDV